MASLWDRIKAKGSTVNLHGQRRLAFLPEEQELIAKALDEFGAEVEKAFHEGYEAACRETSVKVTQPSAASMWNKCSLNAAKRKQNG